MRASANCSNPGLAFAGSACSVDLLPRAPQLAREFTVELQRPPLSSGELALKRALDVVLASALIIALAPLFLVVGLLIKLESSGPVIFSQRRKGFNGREFTIFKFRTMNVLEDGHVIPQARRNDPRLTRVGQVLRATSIDELPQLLNVLRGDMSLVGPRPHAVAHDDGYIKVIAKYAFRQHVKPGLTGWAQVNGFRGETARLDLMERRVDCDLWYIKNWSFWLDLKILVLTGVRASAEAKCLLSELRSFGADLRFRKPATSPGLDRQGQRSLQRKNGDRMTMRANEWVEVRSKQEILQTLDENGRLDGMPFMPQMFQYCGRRFSVYKSAHKTCDPAHTINSRQVANAVHLNLRCDGQAYGGCQAGCRLFWKAAWLKSIDAVRPNPARGRKPAHANSEGRPDAPRRTFGGGRGATAGWAIPTKTRNSSARTPSLRSSPNHSHGGTRCSTLMTMRPATSRLLS